jgi:hypothetical protein
MFYVLAWLTAVGGTLCFLAGRHANLSHADVAL